MVGSLDAARETPGRAGGEKVAAAVADVEAAEVDLARLQQSNSLTQVSVLQFKDPDTIS